VAGQSAGAPRHHRRRIPNLFLILGPNTGLGHNSVVIMIEAQRAWVADVDRMMRGTVWTAGGCKSWYLDSTGRNSTLWPRTTWAFRRRLARFRAEEYVA
jgi:cation diffusion facilitator CzcD-associated flavoprotein CzcO